VSKFDDQKQPVRYGITPLAFIAFVFWLIPALVALLTPVIFGLMYWLLE